MNELDKVARRFRLFIYKHLSFHIELHAVIGEQDETIHERVDFTSVLIEDTHSKKIVMPGCIKVMYECVGFIQTFIKFIHEVVKITDAFVINEDCSKSK